MRQIHVLYRTYDARGDAKSRPPWFSRRGCLLRLLDTADAATRVTAVFDGPEVPADHYLAEPEIRARLHDVVCLTSAGCGSLSHTATVRLVCDMPGVHDNDVVYMCEDDYMHLPGWPRALREGLGAFDYVTLYDHPDKYQGHPDNRDGTQPCIVVPTATAHWRTAPSTTDTYATLVRIVKADAAIAMAYATGPYSSDHERFLALWAAGRTLGTRLPALATHCQTGYLAPAVDWEAAAATAASSAPVHSAART